ncbi:hypothetical protein FRC10_008425 [Ceratobasidium sp. 414]|nr:hypothetical protein FRC10_008425 [Ceratobasidium sp. 414]
MPKSSKKRKEKAADFAKAKLKLGKGKKPASNEIDTSFKARSVALPNQTIRTEEHVAEQGMPTTRRRLTYDDLLVHLKHYSPATRKDALQGLRELLSDHPEILVPNLGSLLGAMAKLIADDDHSVRKVFITFLEWILDQIPLVRFSPITSPEFPPVIQSIVTPHAPPLLLFAAAALAHISVPIRGDAVRVIGVLLERTPRAVVSGASLRGRREEGPGARILEGLMAAIGAGEPKGVGGSISLANTAKCTLLETLSTFLRHALLDPLVAPESPNDPLPTWYLSSAFPSTSAFDSFTSVLTPQACLEGHRIMLNRLDLVSGPVGLEVDQISSSVEDNPLNTLVSRLHPIITATFLDNTPQLRLDPSPSSASVELVVKVVELTRLVYGTSIRDGSPNDEIFENLNTLLGHMAPYFPFGEAVGLGIGEIINIKTQEAMQGLDIAYCELVSLLLSRPQQSEQSTKRHLRLKKRGVGLSDEPGGKQVREVAAYIVKCLREEIGSAMGFASTLSPMTYTALLPTLWALRGEQEVMPTILRHATSTPGGNKAVKRAAVEFVGRIVLVSGHQSLVHKF